MKYFKINHKLIYGIILIIFLMQIILISHRNSFSFVLIKDFYKKNAGLEEGIKNREIFDIITIIKKNSLKDFKLSEKPTNIHRQYLQFFRLFFRQIFF